MARNTSRLQRRSAAGAAWLCCAIFVAISDPSTAAPAPAIGRLEVAAVARVGNQGADIASAIAPADDGRTVAIGMHFDGRLEAAGATLKARGGGDVAVVAFGRELTPRWSRHLAGTAHDEIRALAFTRDQFALGGFFVGESGFDGDPASARATAQGGADGYVAFVNARGVPVGLSRVGGKQADLVRSLEPMPGGQLLIGGHFQAAARFAPGTAGVIIGAGGTDVFLQRLDAQRKVRWARTFGGAGDDELAAMAALPDGGSLLLLRHEQPLELRVAGTTKTVVPRSGHDALLLWLDADGNTTRALPVVSPGADDLHLLTVRADRTIVLAGEFQGEQRWSVGSKLGAVLRSRGSTDVVLLLLDALGSLVAQRQFGSIGPDTADALASHGPHTWLALGWQGRLPLDARETVDSSDTSALLLRLAGDGAPTARIAFEGEGVQKVTALAAQTRHVWATGVFAGSLIAPGIAEPLESAGKSDVFVVRIDSMARD